LIKLVLFLALAYLCYRLLRRAGSGRAVAGQRRGADADAAPSIDRSRVVDAEYREVEGETRITDTGARDNGAPDRGTGAAADPPRQP